MASLDDILGSGKTPKKTKPGQLIDIEMSCPICNTSADQVYYDRESKKVYTYCSNDHEEVSEIDLSWLIT